MTFRQAEVELGIDSDPQQSTGTIDDRHRMLLDRIAKLRGLSRQQLAAQGVDAIGQMVTDHVAKAITPELLEAFLKKYIKT